LVIFYAPFSALNIKEKKMRFKILTILFFSFLFGGLASANTPDVVQNTYNTDWNYGGNASGRTGTFCQTFKPQANPLYAIKFYWKRDANFVGDGVDFDLYHTSLADRTYHDNNYPAATLNSELAIGEWTEYVYEFSSAQTLTLNDTYLFCILLQNYFDVDGDHLWVKAATPASTYANGSLRAYYSAPYYSPNCSDNLNYCDVPAPDGGDLTFTTYAAPYVPYTPPTFQINLLTPSPTAPYDIYYGQPATYTFTYENPLNWYPQIRFMVKRKADPQAHAWPDYINSSTFWTTTAATSTLTLATSTFQLPDGVYNLDAYFWANIPASPVHATTTFTINTGGTYGGYSFATTTENKLFGIPEIDYATICEGIATSTDWTNLHIFGDIECGVKRALYATVDWAFVPSFDTLQNFKISYELFKGCFPFNAYFQLTDTITSAASSTASTTTGTIKIPFIHTITGGGTFYMLDAVSSSTLSNWIGETNYNLFRTTIGYFFWLIAAAVVFFTIKFI
jgi:hypothetical protein